MERERRLDLLRKRKRGEAIEELPPSPPEAAAAARQRGGDGGKGKTAEEGEEGEDEDAVAAGAKRGLDNAGLKIPEGKEGYVEGARHKGHVHLFADVADLLGKFSIVWAALHVFVCVFVWNWSPAAGPRF